MDNFEGALLAIW